MSSAGGDSWMFGPVGGSAGNGDFYRDDQSLTTSDLRQQQMKVMEEQDQGLEAIAQNLARTKRIAVAIGEEVEDQNDLIDEIKDKTDNVNTKFTRENRHVDTVLAKSSTTLLWVIIVCLFLAIVLILILG